MEIKPSNKVKKIAIAGGGTAGWMTAAALAKILGDKYAEIFLIESDEIGIIGVGEATIPQINIFNRILNIDENDFLKKTFGTFKLGIEFVNWRKVGAKYFHPFGAYGVDMNGVSFHSYWLKLQSMGMIDDVNEYNLQSVAAKHNKFMRAQKIPNSPVSAIANAFHFDASLYAKYLRNLAQNGGVKRHEGKISKVNLDGETGYIKSLTLEDGRDFDADFFIDCTGFRSLLLGDALGVGFEDFSKFLPVDRAIAVPCTSDLEPTPYTRSTAHSAGWQWRIPLQHRIGNGHVFSSEFMSEQEATDILMNNLDGKPLADPRMIKFKTGRRTKQWEKNCVAIGLSSGFVEPLESTAIHLIQSSIAKLLQMFPDKGFEQKDIDYFNKICAQEYDGIRDFIVLHYHVTEREDSEFWRYVKNMEVPAKLVEKIELFQSRGRIFRENDELFNDTSWFAVMIGQGLKPRSYEPVVDAISEEEIKARLLNIKTVIAQSAQKLPMHSEFIAKYCKA